MDLLEFCAKSIGEPINIDYHKGYQHHHLRWDREAGLKRFVEDVNLQFARNGVAFELTPDGKARRLLPQPLSDVLAKTLFRTGDTYTDNLLETACRKIVSPKPDDRQDALEKLWDAFERLKTLEPGKDKCAQADALLDRAAPPGSKLREVLNVEFTALTNIGNGFRIRHSETNREALATPEQIDFLFFRLFASIRFVLKTTGRGE